MDIVALALKAVFDLLGFLSLASTLTFSRVWTDLEIHERHVCIVVKLLSLS